jgi:hypothetical protein
VRVKERYGMVRYVGTTQVCKRRGKGRRKERRKRKEKEERRARGKGGSRRIVVLPGHRVYGTVRYVGAVEYVGGEGRRKRRGREWERKIKRK